jgi:hypothetical protein
VQATSSLGEKRGCGIFKWILVIQFLYRKLDNLTLLGNKEGFVIIDYQKTWPKIKCVLLENVLLLYNFLFTLLFLCVFYTWRFIGLSKKQQVSGLKTLISIPASNGCFFLNSIFQTLIIFSQKCSPQVWVKPNCEAQIFKE